MVAKKKRGDYTATVNYEGTPMHVDHDIVVPYIKKHSLDREDLRELLQMIGYVPYIGGSSTNGSIKRTVRPAQFTLG